MANGNDVIGYLFAATVAAGGIMGYVKAGSLPSLGAGIAFGAILGLGAQMNSQNPPKPLLQLGTSIVLAGVMGSRWSRSGKMMPAGMICILSCATIVRNLVVYHKHLPLLGGRQA
ncbi:transmembrane protein 14 homolog [Eupeodes corollae]|uniref:transmembrane protein 14 homolog n=1 Tax=Eupeodes corollae TaxID=290404 RepID=UPI002491E795|nr:transmembrane protein 14 homolog [Eupeodes corollae]